MLEKVAKGLLPGERDTNQSVHQELSVYAINHTQLLLNEVSALIGTDAEPPLSPQTADLRKLEGRSIEMVPIVTTVASFGVILLLAWICKRLLRDRLQERSDWWVRGLRTWFELDTKPAASASASKSASKPPLWLSALRLLFCVGGFLVTYIWYGVIQVSGTAQGRM